MIYFLITLLLSFLSCLTILFLAFFSCFIVLFFYDKVPVIGDKSLFSNVFFLGRDIKNMFLMAVSYFLLKPFNLLFLNLKGGIYAE